MNVCGKSFHDERGEVVECSEENLCRACLQARLNAFRDHMVSVLVPEFTIGQFEKLREKMGIRGIAVLRMLVIAKHVDEEIHKGAKLIPTENICKDGEVVVPAKMLEDASDFLEEFAAKVPGISAVIYALRTQGKATP